MAKHASHHFLQSALFQWIVSFSREDGRGLGMENLSDGIIFGEVARVIHPESFPESEMITDSSDVISRLHNLTTVMNHLLAFTQTQLRSVITLELPDLHQIASDPSSNRGIDEVEKLILIILGIGVECENRAPLIENMKGLSLENQESLVALISDVTKNYMQSLEFDERKEEVDLSSTYSALRKLANERTQYYQLVQDYKQTPLTNKKTPERPSVLVLTQSNLQSDLPEPPPTPGTVSAIQSENSSLRRRLNQIQAAADERQELVEDVQQEIQKKESLISKLNLEKRDLLRDAQSSAALKTELDSMRDKASKLEKLEGENGRLRERLEDLDYYKKQVSDLKQQKLLSEESRANVDDRVAALTAKLKSYDEMSMDYTRLKGQLDTLAQEREMDMTHIKELLEKNTQLEIECQNLLSERSNRDLEASLGASTPQSLQSELTETEATLRAQISLKDRELSELRGAKEQLQQLQSSNRELERNNLRLTSQQHTDRKESMRLKEEVELLKVKASKVDRLEMEVSEGRSRAQDLDRYRQKVKEYRLRSDQLLESKALLEEELSNQKDRLEQLADLQQEVYSLRAKLDSLNEERQVDLDTVQDLMKQNAQLAMENQSFMEQGPPPSPKERPRTPLTPMESPFSPSRPTEAEMALRAKVLRLEREAREGEKASESLRHAKAQAEEYEKSVKRMITQGQNAKLEIARLKEEVETYRQRTEKMEAMKGKLRTCEQKLLEIERVKANIQEIRNENIQLFETKAILQDEVSALTARTQKMSSLQSENAMYKVRLDTLEQERQEELHKMRQLLETNVKIEMDRHQIKDQLELLEDSFTQMRHSNTSTPNNQLPAPSPRSPLRTQAGDWSEERARSQAALNEMQRITQKMSEQASDDRTAIVRLKEELKREQMKVLEAQAELATARNDLEDSKREKEFLREEAESRSRQPTPLDVRYEESYTDTIRHKEERIRVLEARLDEALFQVSALKEQNISLRRNVSTSQPNLRLAEMSFASLAPRDPPHRTHSISTVGLSARVKQERDRANRGRYTPSPEPNSPPAVRRGPEGQDPSPTPPSGKDSVRMREQIRSLKGDNKSLVSDLLSANQLVVELETNLSRFQDRGEMLEALHRTMEEENKALLAQTNKLLIQNQDLMMRTLESKDIMIEEERIFNDRLGELEDDKTSLVHQLETHKREMLAEQIKALKEKRKGGFVKRGAQAIGKKLKHIRKRQDEEDARYKPSFSDSSAPSRLSAYSGLSGPGQYPEDLDEFPADLTPASLASEGSELDLDPKRQSSLRRRRRSSGKSQPGAGAGGSVSSAGVNTSMGSEMLSLSDFLQDHKPSSRKSDSGSGSQRSDQLTPSQLNLNTNSNNNNNNQLSPQLDYVQSESDLSLYRDQFPSRPRNSTFTLPDRSPVSRRDLRMTSSPNSHSKQALPTCKPHRRLVMTSQLRNSKYPFPSDHALSCSDLLDVCSHNSPRSQQSLGSDSGAAFTPQQPRHSHKRHSVASTQPRPVPSQGPFITRTFSHGQTGVRTSPLRYASALPECSVLKSVGDLEPRTPGGIQTPSGIFSQLGIMLPSQIIHRVQCSPKTPPRPTPPHGYPINSQASVPVSNHSHSDVDTSGNQGDTSVYCEFGYI